MPRWIRSLFSPQHVRHLVVEMCVATCLATTIWLYMHSRAHQTLDHVQVPIVVQLAASQRDLFDLELPPAPKATVSFTGPGVRMRELRKKLYRGQLQATISYVISEDRSKESTFADVVHMEEAVLNVPPGILVEWFDPNLTLPVTVHRLAERSLPVRLEYTGDVRVSGIKLDPPTVLVRGPKSLLDRAQSIATLPFEFTTPEGEETKEEAKASIGLVGEIGGRPVQVTPALVDLRAKVQPRKRVREIVDVPIRFAIPDRYPWQPRFEGNAGKLNLRVIGPTGDESPRVRAYIDLDQQAYSRGRNDGPVRIELPKEFELVEHRTPLTTFYLDERGSIQDTAKPTPGFEIRPTSNKKD
jgi:hypothetical protein